jgi:hypothetical protein
MDATTLCDAGFKTQVDDLIDRYAPHGRERVWGRKTLFWSMAGQALEFNASCALAVKTLQATGRRCSASTAAFCKARAKFPEGLLDRLLDLTAEFAAPGQQSERRVLQIDGVSFTLADTPANRAQYDTPSGQAEGCGFPSMSALAVRAASTGAFLALFPGNWKTHDFRLFIAAISFFQAGDIIVADRAFCAYAALAWLRMIGADMVCRLHQRRRIDLAKARRNAKGDWTVVWRKGVHAAKSPVSAERFESLPEELAVRIVKSIEQRKGFRSKEIFIATTLLDATLYPARLIREIYQGRWKIEESFRDIKDSMNYGFIRSRSPASVMKTLKVALIAHNLTRGIGAAAAHRHRVRWERISFKGAVVSVRLFLLHRLVRGTALGVANFRRLLAAVAGDLVEERPGRREPRAVKKRAKPYPLLTCNRHEYQEIPHKSRYRKSRESA